MQKQLTSHQEWRSIFEILKENYFPTKILYLAKLIINIRDRMYAFLNVQCLKNVPLVYPFLRKLTDRGAPPKQRIESRKKKKWGKIILSNPKAVGKIIRMMTQVQQRHCAESTLPEWSR